MQFEYAFKNADQSWNEAIELFGWRKLTPTHTFSECLEYRFRVVKPFISSYYQDTSDGEVKWFDRQEDLDSYAIPDNWRKVDVTPAE